MTEVDCVDTVGGSGDDLWKERGQKTRRRRKRGSRLTGGRSFLNRPQLIGRNHLCCLTSEAPD